MSAFAAYLQRLQDSQLIEPAGIDCQLERYQDASAGPADDGAAFGERLVQDGLLTAWQQEQLLRMRVAGFHVDGYTLLEALDPAVYLAVPEQSFREKSPGEYAAERVTLSFLSKDREFGGDSCFQQYFQPLLGDTSPRLARVIGSGVHGQRKYVIAEHGPGELLQRIVDRRGPLDIATAVHVLREGAQGLAALHEMGLMRGWLCPSDLIVSERLVKVTGVALGWGEWRTLNYFGAPEQEAVVNESSDVYSLGCIIYYALTQSAPFKGKSPAQTLMMHQTMAPPDVRLQRPDTPAWLAELCQQMMATLQRDRPQNMDAVRQALAGHVSLSNAG